MEGDLGSAYNHAIRDRVCGEWICVSDMDTCIFDSRIPTIISRHVHQRPETGIFTCYTNRIGVDRNGFSPQLLEGCENDSIAWHAAKAREMASLPDSVRSCDRPIAGFLMVFHYDTWERAGGFDKGIFVDGKFSKRVLEMGKPILVMENVYVFHHYRDGATSRK